MATLNQSDNPYVGPRTFQPEERAKFFGRGREARELTSLIVSNRLVLFYSPSGAGKSSLLNTMIGPMLTEAGFEVLPTGRVSGYSGDQATAANIYVYNLLLSLHKSEDIPANFGALTISQFLDNLVRHSADAYYYDPQYVYPPDTQFKPRVLIVDQFEELATTNAALWPQRADFFKQLAEAMALDGQLWIVLTMREDFVARFDPYLHLTPSRLRHRYYMERLTRQAAIEAMQMPVKEIRPFDPEAIELLADNLLRIRAADGQEEERLAQFVEPVQLQAVCYQMWEELRHHPGATITTDDVTQFANVDKALTKFYEEMIRQTVGATAVSEMDLRDWFEEELITEAGTRNMVYRGEEMTGSLPTEVADYVRGQFILSEVVRPGGTWYELVHDRFVSAIVAANGQWRQDQPLIRLSMEWDRAGRPEARLLSGQQLNQLEETGWQALGPLVADYIAASRQLAQKEAARKQAEEEKLLEEWAKATRFRRLTRALSVAIWIAVIALCTAITLWAMARNETTRATRAEETAVQAQATAIVGEERVVQQSEAINEALNEALVTAASQAAAHADLQATYLSLAAESQNLLAVVDAQRISAEQTRDSLQATLVSYMQLPPSPPPPETRVTPTPTPNINATVAAQAQELVGLQQTATAAAPVESRLLPANISSNAVILDVPYRSQWDADASDYSSDDGPTALAMLLNAAGVDMTPNRVYDYLPPKRSTDFVSLSELTAASRSAGLSLLRISYQSDEEALANLKILIIEGRPIIALVKYEPWKAITGNSFDWGHFVLVVGYDDDFIYFHDSLFGAWTPRDQGAYFQMPTDLFLAGWGGFPVTENPNFTGLIPDRPVASRLDLTPLNSRSAAP